MSIKIHYLDLECFGYYNNIVIANFRLELSEFFEEYKSEIIIVPDYIPHTQREKYVINFLYKQYEKRK